MLNPCNEALASNDYFDLIIRDGALARKTIEGAEDYCITEINEKWAILSINYREFPAFTYEVIGYLALPKVYGLEDVQALNASGVLAVREQPVLSLYGTGTYIAVIDTGINWRHKAFINSDGTSRIEFIYDQQENQVYSNEEINKALLSDESTIPSDENGHGTYLAGIAAGNIDLEKNFSGVAPYAKIIVVKLRQAKPRLKEFYSIREDVDAFSETDIMLAVNYITKYAEKNVIPISYCIGLGSTLGNHAGISPLGSLLADEAEVVGRCVSIATGNEGNNRLHFSAVSNELSPTRVEIRVGPNNKGFTTELWSSAPEVYSVEIISPSGQIVRRISSRTGVSTRLNFIFDDTELYVYNKQFESLSGQNLLVLRFKNPAEGIWTINVYGRDLLTGEFDMWIMNESFLSGETYFIKPDAFNTITNPANVRSCIAVSAYDSRNNSLFISNGRGFNSYNIVKPDFCAPGVDINVPSSISNDTYTVASGTSIAVAFYSGMAALIQEYGIVRGNIEYLRTSEIKNITISGCTRLDGVEYPSPEWGNGIVNIFNSLEFLRRE